MGRSILPKVGLGCRLVNERERLHSRWGNFCMIHWEKSRRRVCWSVILPSNEVIYF